MKRTRTLLLAAFVALGVSACEHVPFGPESGAGTLQGLIALPEGTHAAWIEIRSGATIDSIGVGFGQTHAFAPSVQEPGSFRALLASVEPLPTELPIRVFTQNTGAPAEGSILERADQAGQISIVGGTFWLK